VIRRKVGLELGVASEVGLNCVCLFCNIYGRSEAETGRMLKSGCTVSGAEASSIDTRSKVAHCCNVCEPLNYTLGKVDDLPHDNTGKVIWLFPIENDSIQYALARIRLNLNA